MVPSTCLPTTSLCLYPWDFLPMAVKVYCPCRDSRLCKHYTHNHTSLKKYFAVFQCFWKWNVNQAFLWTFDIRISITCILLKTQIFLSVDRKKEQKAVAPQRLQHIVHLMQASRGTADTTAFWLSMWNRLSKFTLFAFNSMWKEATCNLKHMLQVNLWPIKQLVLWPKPKYTRILMRQYLNSLWCLTCVS